MKRLLAALTLPLLVWACSGSESGTAGATSETTNGIALRVADVRQQPLARARINLYSKVGLAKLDSTVTDESGMAFLQIPAEDCYLEGIAGGDSSLMVWNDFETSSDEIILKPAASIVILADGLDSGEKWMSLAATPYSVQLVDGAYVFAHVPAGEFKLLHGDDYVAQIIVDAGDTISIGKTAHVLEPDIPDENPDTSAVAPDSIVLDSAGIFVFEDFEDGDSLNNLAKYYPNHGWYFTTMADAQWIRPGAKESFSVALDSSDEQGRFLSTQFDTGDSGMVILGSHLGTDSSYFDLSGLTAVRLTYRSDCDFSVALEHFEAVGPNVFNKSLWSVEASEQWTEVTLKPGDERVAPAINQLEWGDVSKEVALFSIFVQQGSFLQVSRIVFVGVNFVYYVP